MYLIAREELNAKLILKEERETDFKEEREPYFERRTRT